MFFTLSCAESRWPEVSISILKSLGHQISFQRQFCDDGVVSSVFIDGIPFEEFIARKHISRSEILRKHVVQVTRVFNKRVQCFIRTIVLAEYDGAIPVMYFTYRMEMATSWYGPHTWLHLA